MEITQGNLAAMFTGFDMIFQRAFDSYPSYYESISSVQRSGTRQTVYPWFKRTPQIREWLGDRALQALEATAYTIVNKDWEATIEIDRNDVQDDTYDLYGPGIAELGRLVKIHPDQLIFPLIKLAVTTPADVLGYDGQPFFSATHPVGPAGAGRRQAIASNVNSGGAGAYWFLIDASRAIRPFIYQLRQAFVATRMTGLTDEAVFSRKKYRYGVDGRDNVGVALWQLAYASNQALTVDNYTAAVAALRSIKTDAGVPFGAWSSAKNRFLLVPPALEGVAKQLLHTQFAPGSAAAGTVVTTQNIWRDNAELIVSEYLD